MTKLELEAIRKRMEKAAAGPWFESGTTYVVNNVRGDSWEWDADLVAETQTKDDAEFIAHAREDIPKLLAEIERLRNVITVAMDETSCDDTWEYLRRIVFGEEQLDLPYRIGGGSE